MPLQFSSLNNKMRVGKKKKTVCLYWSRNRYFVNTERAGTVIGAYCSRC